MMLPAKPVRLAAISSFFSPELLGGFEALAVPTPWGDAAIELAHVDGRRVACIWRYGRRLARPSHRINYRANVWALRLLGVERVISQNAIGSVNPDLPPGTVVIPDDFIDFAPNRPKTFFDADDVWTRVDLTDPFCVEIRRPLLAASDGLFDRLRDGGVFLGAEGPRFESAAEIRMFRQWGADIVGTPLVPEVILAREAEICFASIAPIINYATGLAPSVTHVGSGSMVDFYYSSGFHATVERAIRVRSPRSIAPRGNAVARRPSTAHSTARRRPGSRRAPDDARRSGSPVALAIRSSRRPRRMTEWVQGEPERGRALR